MSYSNRTSRFETNDSKGHPHGPGTPGGSVFKEPLLESNGHTLWLEYVWDKTYHREMFWLMWYDLLGNPTGHDGCVMSLDQIQSLGKQLLSFKPDEEV